MALATWWSQSEQESGGLGACFRVNFSAFPDSTHNIHGPLFPLRAGSLSYVQVLRAPPAPITQSAPPYDLFLFMFKCLRSTSGRLWKPEEGIGSHNADLTGRCETPDLVSVNL